MLEDRDELYDAPSAGGCDEPSYTTPAGFPICERCGLSTRNMNQIVCAPCRKGTRLMLTAEDRRWLRQIKVKVNSATAPPRTVTCPCFSKFPLLVHAGENFCFGCASADQMNAYLETRGLR